MTEHRCTDGTWRPGKVKDCALCKARLKTGSVKKSGES